MLRAFAAALSVILALWTPRVAFAHAELTGSEPPDGAVLATSPQTVRLLFGEPIERQFFAVEVYTARRVRVDKRDAHIPADNIQAVEASLQDLEPGVYTVVWRVLSIDSHVVRGVFAFSVGVPGVAAGSAVLPPGLDLGGAPFALGATVRWLTYLAAAALVGGFAFGPLILLPAFESLGAAAPRAGLAATRRLTLVAWIAVIALFLLTLVALLVQAADAAGQSLGEVFAGRATTLLLTGTKYGALWFTRAGLVAALLAALVAVSIAGRPARVVLWTGTALGAAFLLAVAASGHASAVARRTWITVGADWLHLLFGAIWIGGLLQLLVALPAVLRFTNDYTRRLVLARVVRRFSFVAAYSIAVIVITGVYAGTVHVPSWDALSDTFYGAALSGKLVLVAPLLLFGAFNLLVIHPRFVRAAHAAQPGRVSAADLPTQRWFRRLVLGETLLAVAVFGATAILSGLPPATTSPGEGKPVRQAIQVAGQPPVTVTFDVTPNQAGANTIAVTLTDAQGRPTQAQRVAVAFSHQDMEMGEREVVLTGVGNGRYEAAGSQLSMAGRWRAEIRLRGAGAGAAQAQPGPGADVAVPIAFTTGQPAGTGRPLFSPARIALFALTPQTFLGLLVIAIAAVLFIQAQRPRVRRQQRTTVVAAAAFFGVVGLAATGASVASAYQRSLVVATPVTNAISASAASLARGQTIYTQSCLVCHGAEGRGDGPAGRTLRPPPADLRVHMAAGHTDAQLFDWITNGVSGTAMPAWKDQLLPEDRWHVINYIRSFATQSTP